MTTSVNYPSPVMVNGYPCQNCTQVDQAKAHIDPQHPKAGPYGLNAAQDPSLTGKIATTGKTPDGKAVSFGGSLSGLNGASSPSSTAPAASPRGSQVDISA